MDDEVLAKTVEEIARNHRKILDDFAKAYLAQCYYENGEVPKPGDFILYEQVPMFHEGKNCYIKKYWFEPKE